MSELAHHPRVEIFQQSNESITDFFQRCVYNYAYVSDLENYDVRLLDKQQSFHYPYAITMRTFLAVCTVAREQAFSG